jgi:hypothetical protein
MKSRGWGVGVYRFLRVSAAFCTLSGCTFEGAALDYLVDVFPQGSVIQVTDSCSSAFGAGGGAAVFEASFEQNGQAPYLTSLSPELGTWTREDSLQKFAEKYDFEVGIAATVLDGRDCFRSLREDADAWLFEPKPGLYFRSTDQNIVVMLPDNALGTGVLFSQGR